MIEGLEVRNPDLNAEERGNLVEIFRQHWELYDPLPEMAYYSLTYPWIIRARHRQSGEETEHFICPKVMINVAVYDTREESTTQDDLKSFVIGEQNQNVIRNPWGLQARFQNDQ